MTWDRYACYVPEYKRTFIVFSTSQRRAGITVLLHCRLIPA